MRDLARLLVVFATCFSGCASYESARTTHYAREYMTEDIEQLIVFNLIRASNGLPFAHYDVVSVQSLVTVKGSSEAGGTNTRASNRYGPAAILTDAIGMVSKGLSGKIGAERANSVTVNVAPVSDEPDIYKSYVGFLNLPRKLSLWPREDIAPGKRINFGEIFSLRRSDERPARDAYVPHTLRRWDERWYYVPAEYLPEFSDLCISLIAREPNKDAGGGKSKTTKALEQISSELMQQKANDL